MSAPSPGTVTRWLRRGATAFAGAAFDALLDSLELGKRTLAWLSHSASARTVVAVVALALVVAGGAAWAAGQRRAAQAAAEPARASEQPARGELGDAP
jgi:hypothetical protein